MARIELNVTISNGSENSMRNLLEMKNLDDIHKKRNGLAVYQRAYKIWPLEGDDLQGG